MLPKRIGRYEVLGQLATGGMAEILLARLSGPSDFTRVVVIKRMLRQLAKQPSYVTMFLDEARVIAKIRHPNVVQVHELGEDEGDPFLVLEYVEGENLASILRRTTAKGEAIEPELAAWIVAETCAGLHAAHELTGDDGKQKNLVHRDVSPQNLFVAYDGHVKLLDFGVALTDDRGARTAAGELKGKYEYMSPEQAEGRPLDRRSDIFALGIVLYELSTGRRLFKRPSHSRTIDAICKEPVVPPSRMATTYPPALEAIVMKALSKDPSQRYATASDMRRELLEVARAFPQPVDTLAERMQRWFAERIVEKKAMLQKARESDEVLDVPASEADDHVEVPNVQEETVVVPRVASKPPFVAIGIGALLLVLLLGGGLVFLRNHSPTKEASTPSASTSPTEPPAPPVVAGPNEVLVHIETTPPRARVTVKGHDVGATPLDVAFPKSTDPLDVLLTAPGYAPMTQTITPDAAQKLVVTLRPVRWPQKGKNGPLAGAKPSSAPAASAAGPDFRRFE